MRFMNYSAIVLAVTLWVLPACNNKRFPENRPAWHIGYDPGGYALNSPDSSVIRFLKWYRTNEDSAIRIDFIKGGFQDTTTFYHVDFLAVERYLHTLRKSGLLSEKYLSGLRDYIRLCDQELKRNPQNDGPAFGFEGDLVMKAQDYMHVWEYLEYALVISKKVDGNSTELDLAVANFHRMHFRLSLVQGTWMIDSLDHKFEDITNPRIQWRLHFHNSNDACTTNNE